MILFSQGVSMKPEERRGVKGILKESKWLGGGALGSESLLSTEEEVEPRGDKGCSDRGEQWDE